VEVCSRRIPVHPLRRAVIAVHAIAIAGVSPSTVFRAGPEQFPLGLPALSAGKKLAPWTKSAPLRALR